jgi:hypothetical protein
MRRAFSCVISTLFVALVMAPVLAFASVESEIRSVEDKIRDDAQSAISFTCGGLMNSSDTRASVYYARREPLKCILKTSCNNYDKSMGVCEGLRCDEIHVPGLGSSNLEKICTNGVCETPVPHRRCSASLTQSRYRFFDCGRATAECFTYSPNLSFEQSYYPFAYNCVLSYTETPVHQDEPKGKASVYPAFNAYKINRKSIGKWNQAPGSSVSTEAYGDSSIGPLTLDNAMVSVAPAVLHPTLDSPMRLDDYPDLERMMSRLLQPPEVRLILPSGGTGLGSEIGPVAKLLGKNSSALRTAAEYLRSMPLLETRYVPVEVAVPSISATELKLLIEEWEAWANLHQDELNSSAYGRVQNNISTLRSYSAIHDSIRDYRLNFPEYLNALLSYTDGINNFFRENWIEYNASQLEGWHQVYENYIPTMSQELRSIYARATDFTSKCLVPACRMDVVPVKDGAHPWDLFPEGSQYPLTDGLRAWTPESLPIWENAHGRITLRHPLTVLGFPLPDITLDLSEIFINDAIKVPVLKLEMHELDILYPPATKDVDEISKNDFPLFPEFKFPKLDLSFPKITLPDPGDSLFVVPEAPQANLSVLEDALIWQNKRIDQLLAVCNNSTEPKTFLVHEYQIYDSKRDPAAVRAVSLTASSYSPRFGAPSMTWLTQYPDDHVACSECTAVRPQRFIRQHLQLDIEWELLQDKLLRAIDEWNAEVRFWSVVPREELIKETVDRLGDSGLPKKLFPLDN